MHPAFDDLIVLDLPPRPEWMRGALCSQTDPELWFPDKGGHNTDARHICTQCPVIDQCLTYALDHHEEHGVWANTTPRQRRRILNNRNTPGAPA